MLVIDMKKPRPGNRVKREELLRPGATVTVVGLKPGSQGAIAVVRWTNPTAGPGRRRTAPPLQPEAMQVTVRELPYSANGSVRQVAF